MSSSVKLHYFNATGRANQIRLALAAGGVAFEDAFADGFPLSAEQKAKYVELTNGTATFAVPILTVDEGTETQQVYVQSSAILRKAGRMGDLTMTLAKDDADLVAYLTDRAVADADDLRTAAYKGILMFGNTPEARDNYVNVVFPKHVAAFEKQFVTTDGAYWGGSSTLSVADVTVYEAIVFFGTRLFAGVEGINDPCGPALKAWIERIESNDRIKAYLEGDFKNIAMKFDKTAMGY
jgi:glutathione S-transferase